MYLKCINLAATMAQQKGIFKISGTVGDINFYMINNKGYARKAGGGFNSKAIKTKPSMQRVRENASEFGHCSTVKKRYRMAFVPFLQGHKEAKLHVRMMRLFTALKDLDSVSVRGERRVGNGLQTMKGRQLLKTFAFTPKHPFLTLLRNSCSFDTINQTLSVQDFTAHHHAAPKSATHIGVMLGVLDFDFDTLENHLRMSPVYYIPMGETASFSLSPTSLAPIVHLGVVILGVRYYEILENSVGATEIYPMGGVGIACDF